MITQEDIETVLGAACYNLGYPVFNAAFYRNSIPAEITDEMLKAECERLKLEQITPVVTLASVQAQLATLTAQLATLTAVTSGN